MAKAKVPKLDETVKDDDPEFSDSEDEAEYKEPVRKRSSGFWQRNQGIFYKHIQDKIPELIKKTWWPEVRA